MAIAVHDDLLDRHRLDTIAEGLTIRRAAVAQQKARRGVPGEGLCVDGGGVMQVIVQE